MTQKEIIQRYLAEHSLWVKAGLVRSIRTPYGNIGFRGDRDLREMYETEEARGKWGLEIEMDGKFRIVRYNPLARVKEIPKETVTYKPYTFPEMTERVKKINAMMVKPEKKELGLF